jgi:hypothetical protein
MASIDLIYGNKSSDLFNTINQAISILNNHSKPLHHNFNEKDEREIGRYDSYAYFDELKEKKITTQLFKQSLQSRGIVDEVFQHRILDLILQNRKGIQFGLGTTTLALGHENNFVCSLNPETEIKLNVISPEKIELECKFQLMDPLLSPTQPALDVDIRFLITPTSVHISTFKFDKISNTENTNNFFEYLQNNQENFFWRFIILIQKLLGMNVGIQIEQTKENAPVSVQEENNNLDELSENSEGNSPRPR